KKAETIMNEISEKSGMSKLSVGKDELDIRRILVAVDLSLHSERTATFAANFAKGFGASIILAHIFATEPVRTLNTNETPAEAKQHDAERKLEELVGRIRRIYPKCEMRLRKGDPAEEIVGLAQDMAADLIITGSHHPGFLTRLFGWDQAPRILHRA